MSNIIIKKSRIRNVPGKGYYGVGLLIVLMVVGHFAAQLTFITTITTENWRIDASSVAAVPTGGQSLAVLPAEPTRDLGDLILNEYHFGEKDVAARSRGSEKGPAERQIALVRAEQSSKEKTRNETRTARLRRAEKILTGF